MTALDTTPEAAAVQLGVYQRLGPEARVRLAIEMSDLVRECIRAGIAARHPTFTPAEITAQLVRDLYGPEVRVG